ncbi:MAG: hypothetical protein RBT37_03810 [Dissulfurispiraceae bacterium]|jgi:hypothetical protein|nr:hypothetical protein [Dissulfurispiraceae bacterium]
MKRLFIITILAASFVRPAECYEVKGLQPLAPYGVFSTFSAETIDYKKFNVGLNFEKIQDPNYYRTSIQFAYGLTKDIELSAALPFVWSWEDNINGTEDIAFGLKHRIYKGSSVLPSVAYLLTVSGNSGRDDFSTEGRIGGGLIMSKKIGPFKGHMNFLYFKPGNKNLHEEYSLNIGTELSVSNRSVVLAELIGKKEFDKNRINMIEWRLGLRTKAADNIFTTIGAGFDIKDRTPDLRIMFSVNFILPSEKNRIERVVEE